MEKSDEKKNAQSMNSETPELIWDADNDTDNGSNNKKLINSIAMKDVSTLVTVVYAFDKNEKQISTGIKAKAKEKKTMTQEKQSNVWQ